MDKTAHWQNVYSTKSDTEVSWYQPEPALSLSLIESVSQDRKNEVVDVGGGSSELVDRLLDRGKFSVTVLDISRAALERSQARLGSRSVNVNWIVADIVSVSELGAFDIWHDRAVFHFLTAAEDRRRYVDLATRSVRRGGHLILATFATDGPAKCSGLDVCRYDAQSAASVFGDSFELLKEAREEHMTPWGKPQGFFYGLFQKV